MNEQSKRLKWHLLFLLTLGLMVLGVYSASKTIDYSWNWQRVLPYIVDTSPIDIIAESNGTVTVKDDGILEITYEGSNEKIVISEADELLVDDVPQNIFTSPNHPRLAKFLGSIL